jgi:hypothetical protein
MLISMLDEILAEIDQLANREFGTAPRSLSFPLTKSDVHRLFTLARKLIERLQKKDRVRYALLNFYCDWTLHSKIDRSTGGSLVLARIHDVIFSHLKTTDTSSIASDLTAALSFDAVRAELNELIVWHGGRAGMVTQATWNDKVLPEFAEIVSCTPVRIDCRSESILKTIRAKPLKGTSVAEEFVLIKVPTKTLVRNAPEDKVTFCMLITTTDTTKFIVPLVRS